jgi:hypothetical protein
MTLEIASPKFKNGGGSIFASPCGRGVCADFFAKNNWV